MRCLDGSYSRDRYLGYKNSTILEVTCFCGKVTAEWQDYANHMMAKHPKLVRKHKKSGHWQQVRIDWKVRKKTGEAS